MAHSSCPNIYKVFDLYLSGYSSGPSPINCTMNQSSCDLSYGPTAPYETKSYAVAAGFYYAGYGNFEWYCNNVVFSQDIEDIVPNPEDYELFLYINDYGGSPYLSNASSYNGVTGYKVIYNTTYNSFHTMCKSAIKVYAISDLIPDCPPGKIWDPLTGTCIECIEESCFYIEEPYNDVINYLHPNIYNYTIKMNFNCINKVVPRDTTVYLSYIGGSAKNGIDFIAPKEVIIKQGTNEIDFQIEVLDCFTEDKYFYIDIYDGCDDPYLINILSCGYDYEDSYDHRKYGTCCDYIPKDFIEWVNYHNYEHFYNLKPHVTKNANDKE